MEGGAKEEDPMMKGILAAAEVFGQSTRTDGFFS
jgi:hypothetical protein